MKVKTFMHPLGFLAKNLKNPLEKSGDFDKKNFNLKRKMICPNLAIL
jgi:hypothetical protein